MSDYESLREDGRREDADWRARKHVCHLVNSATPEPPECAACELEAEEKDEHEENMNKSEVVNAKIDGTMLGYEDHGILSFSIGLDYGNGGHQGAGGYCLDTPVKDEKGKFLGRVGTAAGMEMVARLMRVVGVSKWEDLKGQHVRVKADHSKVYAIGHLLKNDWLDFEAFWKEIKTDKMLEPR